MPLKRSRRAVCCISITDITYSTIDGDYSVVTIATKSNEVVQYQEMTPFNKDMDMGGYVFQ